MNTEWRQGTFVSLGLIKSDFDGTIKFSIASRLARIWRTKRKSSSRLAALPEDVPVTNEGRDIGQMNT